MQQPWTGGSLLPPGRSQDWSRAGYRESTQPIPNPPISYNVKNFGAKGDGVTDDTAAIQAAIKDANNRPGVVFFPPGTYVLTRPITIVNGRVVLRGAGPGETTIFIPNSLSDVFQGTWTSDGGDNVQSAWSSGGGFITFVGKRQDSGNSRTLLATIREGVSAGSNRLLVKNVGRCQRGQRVRIYVNDKSTFSTRRRSLLSEGGEQPQRSTDLPGSALEGGGGGGGGSGGVRVLGSGVPAWVEQDPVFQVAMEALTRGLGRGDESLTAEEALAADEEFAAAASSGEQPMGPQGDSTAVGGAPAPESWEGGSWAGAPAGGPLPDWDGEGASVPSPAPADGGKNVSFRSVAPTVVAWAYGEGLVYTGEDTDVIDKDEVAMNAKITNVVRTSPDGEGYIELDRALIFPVKVDAGWQGLVHLDMPSIQDSGIEKLTIRFKHTLALQHHADRGYNAIQFKSASNVFIRQVNILNADNGIFFSWVHRSTIEDVVIGVTKSRVNPKYPKDNNGHHALGIDECQANLIQRVSWPACYIHDYTVASSSSMNVLQDSSGRDLNLDHHRTAPFLNLFSNLNVGLGTRPFESGGKQSRGAHSGRGNTYWNLHSQSGRALNLPGCQFGPFLTFVGRYKGSQCPGKFWIVQRLGQKPDNVFAAQRRRFGRG